MNMHHSAVKHINSLYAYGLFYLLYICTINGNFMAAWYNYCCVIIGIILEKSYRVEGNGVNH